MIALGVFGKKEKDFLNQLFANNGATHGFMQMDIHL